MMKSSLRFAGAATLCAALLLTACAKRTDQTTTSTDTTQSAASAAPDAAATTPAVIASTTPDTSAASPGASAASPGTSATAAASATTAPVSFSTTVSTLGNGKSSGGYIDIPVYPGAAESKEGAMSVSTNTGSFTVKVYTSKDDTKKIADWYKSHLPPAFKGGVITAGDKTVGTFSDEHTDGDQTVLVASQDDKTTRIQISTKHGK